MRSLAAFPLLLVLLLSGCADRASRAAEVDGFQLLRDGQDQLVKGRLVNTGEAPIRGADLTVALYGEDNQVLGETRISLNADLATGESEAFEQELDVDFQAQAARVRQILVY